MLYLITTYRYYINDVPTFEICYTSPLIFTSQRATPPTCCWSSTAGRRTGCTERIRYRCYNRWTRWCCYNSSSHCWQKSLNLCIPNDVVHSRVGIVVSSGAIATATSPGAVVIALSSTSVIVGNRRHTSRWPPRNSPGCWYRSQWQYLLRIRCWAW